MGKALQFRDAQVNVAAFVLSLRTDSKKSGYLSSVSGELADLYDPSGDSFVGVRGYSRTGVRAMPPASLR